MAFRSNMFEPKTTEAIRSLTTAGDRHRLRVFRSMSANTTNSEPINRSQ